MLKRLRKNWTKGFSTGQTMTEYMLIFVAVISVLIIAFGVSGGLTDDYRKIIYKTMLGIKCLVLDYCFDPAGCTTSCGNECCERNNGEGNECLDCCRPRTSCLPTECGIISDGCVGTINCGPCP